MWRSQFILALVLLLLTIPLYFLDHYLLRPTGGNWISLDFRGVLLWGYLIFIGLHLMLSSLGLHFSQKQSLLSIHLVSGLASVVLMIFGYFIVVKTDQYRGREKYEVRMEERQKLAKVIQLSDWWLVPNTQNPEEVHIKVKVSESGRFAGGVQGREAGENGRQIFAQEKQHQFPVKAGEEFTYVSELKRYNEGEATQWEIRLSLFKDQTGSAPENITKIFRENPAREEDGHFFYGELSSPSSES